MRGYFGIGVEGLSKPMNAGNLFRSAHGFGASFVFTINAQWAPNRMRSDTSRAPDHMPLYLFDRADQMVLPKDCSLIGIELLEEAVELPSFRHPSRAAYVLGPERGLLSEELVACCEHVVKIPTAFAINVAVAGAIVMYDRMLAMGRFAERPVSPRAKPAAKPRHVHGGPILRGHRKVTSALAALEEAEKSD